LESGWFGNPAPPAWLKLNPFVRIYIDRLFEDTKSTEAALRLPLPEAAETLQALNKQRMADTLREKVIDLAILAPPGSRLRGSIAPQFIEAVGYAESRMRCLEAAIAVERFRLATRRMPKSLDELVPQFIDAVPVDPYSQRPVILRLEKEAAWIDGVGANLIHEPHNANGDDVRASLERNAKDLQ
jgi:hypothetical protein